MNRITAEIVDDDRSLPPSEFDRLSGEILQVEGVWSEADIETSWKAEVARRVAEDEAGIGMTFSWEEVEAPLRARLHR